MKRVLVGQIMHETNTFSRLPTGLDDFRARYLKYGDEVPRHFRDTRTEIGACLDAAERYGWTLVHPIAANATPSGPVTAVAWNALKGAILAALDAGDRVDGVLLALHGAMVTESTDDAEGELLAEIRQRVGPEIPVAITLDLHANVTDAMVAAAGIVIAYRTYPHVDQYERAMQAAELLDRAMAGKIRPRALVRRGSLITGCNSGRTQAGPMVDLLAQAAAAEHEPGIHAVSVHAGFPWADIAEMGPSVAVTAEDGVAHAAAVADEMMSEIWRRRRDVTVAFLSPSAAMVRARQAPPHGPPLVLADYSDNPGGGGYGDSPNLLRAMVEAGLANAAFAAMVDPQAVAQGRVAGLGATLSVALGGRHDPGLTPPLVVTGTVIRLGDGAFVCKGPMWQGLRMSMGPTLVLRVGGIDVVVCSNRLQITDLESFRSVGIEPAAKAVVAVKSSHHFRAAFAPIAHEVAVVDAGGLVSPDLKLFTYRKVRRPVFPLDLD